MGHKYDPYNDHRGQGYFCNSLWKDGQGFFCSTKAAEGYADACQCSYSENDCHVSSTGEIICESERLKCKSWDAVCRDFEPSIETRARLFGGDAEEMRREVDGEQEASDVKKKHKFLDI